MGDGSRGLNASGSSVEHIIEFKPITCAAAFSTRPLRRVDSLAICLHVAGVERLPKYRGKEDVWPDAGMELIFAIGFSTIGRSGANLLKLYTKAPKLLSRLGSVFTAKRRKQGKRDADSRVYTRLASAYAISPNSRTNRMDGRPTGCQKGNRARHRKKSRRRGNNR